MKKFWKDTCKVYADYYRYCGDHWFALLIVTIVLTVIELEIMGFRCVEAVCEWAMNLADKIAEFFRKA